MKEAQQRQCQWEFRVFILYFVAKISIGFQSDIRLWVRRKSFSNAMEIKLMTNAAFSQNRLLLDMFYSFSLFRIAGATTSVQNANTFLCYLITFCGGIRAFFAHQHFCKRKALEFLSIFFFSFCVPNECFMIECGAKEIARKDHTRELEYLRPKCSIFYYAGLPPADKRLSALLSFANGPFE